MTNPQIISMSLWGWSCIWELIHFKTPNRCAERVRSPPFWQLYWLFIFLLWRLICKIKGNGIWTVQILHREQGNTVWEKTISAHQQAPEIASLRLLNPEEKSISTRTSIVQAELRVSDHRLLEKRTGTNDKIIWKSWVWCSISPVDTLKTLSIWTRPSPVTARATFSATVQRSIYVILWSIFGLYPCGCQRHSISIRSDWHTYSLNPGFSLCLKSPLLQPHRKYPIFF